MTTEPTLNHNIPPRRYLSREEAAAWLGVSVDTFSGFSIPYCDFGPRLKRWDIVDIEAYANDNKRCDSARTSETKRRRPCNSTNATTQTNIGSVGMTGTESEFAEVLGLQIKS